jgi:hypothetical protein
MAQIWKDKIPFLTEAASLNLAGSFSFSGGQIGNISRKALMKKVLNNEEMSLDEIIAMCRNEKLEVKSKIGY